MKKRTSNLSRRIVSLLMSMVLTLTLVTPAAFATEVVDGSSTTIVEGDTNPADTNPGGDTEGKDDVDKNTEDGKDEQPTNPGDEDKNPGEGEGDANKPAEDNKGEENPAEDKKDEDNKDEQPTEEPSEEIDTLEGEGTTPVTVQPSTAWYTETIAANGNATEFTINSAADLLGLAQLVNDGTETFSGKTIMLEDNIVLSGVCYPANENGTSEVSWTPIGDATHAFAGMFDGNGHTIEGLHINETGSWKANTVLYKGLFGNNSGTIKNIIVTGNVTITNNEKGPSNSIALAIKGTGGIVGSNSGVIQSCGFAGTVKVQGYTKKMGQKPYVNVPGAFNGGVVGNGKAVNCWYFCTNTDGASPLGVFGSSDSVLSLSCCCNMTGTVAGTGEKIDTTNFSEAAVKVLNTYAFKNGLKLWGTDASEDSKPYPVFSAQDANDLVLVKVEPFVKNSELNGKVKLNDGSTSGVDAYLVAKDTEVKLIRENDDAYYVTDNSKETYSKESLTKISVPYKANEGGKTVTLYYGTDAEFTASALERAWYYQGNGFAIQTTIYTENGQQKTASAEEVFRLFAVLVNKGIDFRGKTVYLNENVNLNQISDWESIGTETNSFRGTFNGRNGSTYYTISGLNGDLFGVVNGIIQYVTIDGGAGRIVGTLESGTVQYCMSTAKVTGSAGGLVGQNSGTVSSCYYYNADSKNTPAVGGSGTVKNCFYLAETSSFGAESDTGARTVDEFKLGRVAYELGASSSVWVYDTTKTEKMPQLGRSSMTMAVASELKLTKPEKLPEGVKVTLGNDSDKKALTDAAGNQYYYAASGYPEGVSDVPVTFTAPTGYQIVFAPAATQVGGKDYLRITGSNVEYTYSLVKAAIRWYENAGAEKNCVLKSADELMGFCLLANGSIDGEPKNFNGWTLSLGNDIDLENSEWKPIPSFAGEFNGMSHEIKGLNVNYTGDDLNSKTAGMFEKLVSPGKILNLAVSGSVQAVGKLNYVGGIVGKTESGSEIRFCRSNIAVKVDAANSTTNGMAYGGVAGKVEGVISNCLNEGTITVDNIKSKCYIGGVAGQVSSAANLCWNTGSVTASSTANKNIYTGGIVGYGAATNCYNNGSVTGATGKNKYVTGGISGNGNVTNSYNLGAVSGQGAAGITGKGTVTNSYYVCEMNGSIKRAYVNTTETPVTLGADGKTYMAGEKKLVDELNDKHGTNELWFTNPEKNVYLPRHATKWDGETDTDCTFKTITVTYDPNTGVNKDGNSTSVTVSEMVYVVGEDVVTPAKHTVLAADAENLGFKHENGTFNSWTDSNGTKHTAGDIITGITTGITLYAQWDKIWMGEGSTDDPYQISDAEKLTALQTQVNDKGFTYDGKWFKLTDSISLTGNWTPIGTPIAFAGSLDGNGKTIDGLNVNVISGNAGLFDSASGGTFKDLKLNGTVNGTFYAGGLIGGGSGVMLDNIEANVTVSGGSCTGGLVGRLLGTLPATAERTPDISNCTVHGSVIGRRYVGGIATSSGDNSPKIENCHNYASITSTGTGTNNASAAGIWSCNTHNANGKFINCTNNGAVTAQKYAAGIATAGTAVIGCVNSNAVVSNNGLAGGISNNAFTVERCGNVGSITGCKSPSEETGVAGIDNYGQNVLYCYNTGVVTCDNEMWAYGISANGRSKIRNSFSYVAGKDLGLTPNLPNVEVTNSYYLASSATAVSSAGEYATLADFASGKVAWGVDGGTGAHANYWTQGANNYPVPIGEGTSTSYYRAKAECGTGGTVSIKSSRNFTGDADNAVYGPKGMSVTVTATPKDDTFGLKSLTLDLMGTGSTTALESGDRFTLGEANALVVAAFASTGNGGNGGGNGGSGGNGDGTGSDTGDGAGDEDDEGLQDGLNMDVEYNIKGLILSAYGAWGAEGSGKTFAQWLKDSPEVLRALITNSLDNMAVAAMGKKTDEARDLAALLLASLNEHSGLDGQSSDTIAKMLRRYIESGTEAAFSAWLTTGGGMASGTYESIFAQYTNSLLALADRLYTNWESSGTSLTFPQWLDAQQVTMESLSENAEEPDAEPDDTQTTEAPEDVPDGQEAEGGASSGGNSVWEVIGTVVRDNPIIVWSIVAVVAALIIVGAVRRYHKVKRDERDDVTSKK